MKPLALWLSVMLLVAACAEVDGGFGDAGTIAPPDGSDPVFVDSMLVGAGWSFGMCGGYCNADLAVEGEGLVLSGRSHITVEPLYVNRGTLTAVALERIGAAVDGLRGEALDPVYGCPDCADGGAAYLVLARQGLTSQHEMEFGRPPAGFAELYGLAMEMIEALETCRSGELVAVADDCEPFQGF